MKKIIYGVMVCLPIFSALHTFADKPVEKHIVVVICSYNNKDYYERNLGSVFCQYYDNFHVIYINDVSTDGTGELVETFIRERHMEDRVTLINNKERVGAMANLYNAIHSCKNKDIIVTLDGDDWFAHDRVLERINHEYADPNVWMTYGQFCYSAGRIGFSHEIPSEVHEKQTYRTYEFVSTHPRTFYAWLFKLIKKEDLLYNGKFYMVTWDQALMYPMLEMAGTRAHFIPDVLYIYNGENPINDGRIRNDQVLHCEQVIRRQPVYDLL